MDFIPLENKRKSGYEFINSTSKKKRMMKSVSFGGDRRILPRIIELIKVQMSVSEFVDEDKLLSDLQSSYIEYRRKKKGDLKAAIKKAVGLYAAENSGDDTEENFVNDIEFMPDERSVAYQETKIIKKSRLNRSKEHLQVKEAKIAQDKYIQNDNNGKMVSPQSVKDKKLNLLINSAQAPNNENSEVKTKKRSFFMRKQENKGLVLQHPTVTFSDVGGQHNNIMIICKRLVRYIFPQVCSSKKPACGVLFHGPPGCGKTLFARAIAGEMKYPLIEVAGTDLISGISGDSEEKIRSLFEQAVHSSPCVLFIDRIDAIATKIESASKEMEKRIASQLLKSMEGLRSTHADSKVLVIGATNTPDSLDPGFRRGGQFDLEIGIGFPDEAARISILEVICRGLLLPPDFDFRWLARSTPGYVGADLEAVASGATEEASNRILQKLSLVLESDSKMKSKMQSFIEEPGWQLNSVADSSKEFSSICEASKLRAIMSILRSDSESLAEKLTEEKHMRVEDFQMALNAYVPCAKREGFASVPSVTWHDVGALKGVQEELQRMIVWPVKYKDLYDKNKFSSSSGVLLWGPKGCGKTLLAKAVANESGINFLSVKGPELLNMFVGESERSVRRVFERAKNSAPCVILFDELDALCAPRSNSSGNAAADRVVNTLLTEMDGVGPKKQIFVMGTTNRIENIDSAMLRPGRLEERIFVGLPTPEGRVDILKALTKNGTEPKLASDVDLEAVAQDHHCDGFSGADLASLVRRASDAAIKDYIMNNMNNMGNGEIRISLTHFTFALSKTRPSVSKEEREYFEKMKSYEESRS